ncbi:MAG: hypothetical protein GY754_11215 [bacterium]|nr:hypothetical protein [bacterium]
MSTRLTLLKVQDKILSTLAQGYADPLFVSESIFKRTPVNKNSEKFPIWGDYRFVDYGDGLLRPIRTAAKQKDWSLPDYGTYNCLSYALGDKLEDEEIRHSYYNIVNEEIEETMFLMKIARECSRASILTNADSYPDGNKETPLLKWDNDAVSVVKEFDRIKNIVAQKIGVEPNIVLMGKLVFLKLKQKAEFSEKIKYTQKDIVTADLMANLLGVDEILVGESLKKQDKKTAKEPIWGNMTLFCHVTKRNGKKTPTFARAFELSGYPKTYKWRTPPRNNHFEVEHYYDDKIVGPEAGYLVNEPVTVS